MKTLIKQRKEERNQSIGKRLVLAILGLLVGLIANAQVVNFDVSPSAASLTVNAGETVDQVITISNSGNAQLNWEIAGFSIGEPVTFTKEGGTDLSLEENQDRISDNLWLTRNSFYLVNYAEEDGLSFIYGSPVGTTWATTNTVDATSYDVFNETIGAGGEPIPIPTEQAFSMYSTADNRYFDMVFHSWSTNDDSFSYTRTEIPIWASVSASSGSVATGGSEEVTLSFDASGLASGVHEVYVYLTSNATDNADIIVPIEVSVTGGSPALSTDASITFDDTFSGGNNSKTLIILNEGAADLVISDISSDNAVFQASESAITISGFSSKSIIVDFTPDAVQAFAGNLTITSNDAASPAVVSLSGNGLSAPEVSVSPTSFTESLAYGGSNTQTLTIENLGGNDLNWMASLEIPDSEVTFEKASFADWTKASNQDAITPTVTLTRQNSKGIYNVLQENFFDRNDYTSPLGTEWAWGATVDVIYPDNYGLWVDVHDYDPQYMIGNVVSMRSTSENRFFDFEFHSWEEGNEGAGGGGFSYTRTEVPGWISLDVTSGTIASGGSTDVTLTFDADVVGGTYNANLVLSSNDPLTPEAIVPITITISGTPAINVPVTSFDFGDTFIGESSKQQIEIQNTGSADLTVLSISSDNATFTLSSSAVVIPGNSSEMIHVTFTPTTDGVQTGTLMITSDDGSTPTVTIDVSGNGQTEPNINAIFGAMTLDVSGTDPLNETISIENTQGINLAWGIRGNPIGDLPSVLENLNTNYTTVTDVIPDMAVFEYDAEGNNYISDGLSDMYDDGNYFQTNLKAYTAIVEEGIIYDGMIYSDNVIANGTADFGAGTSYFTRHLDGLFVLGATMNGVKRFDITGNLGADSDGFVDASIVEVDYLGVTYQGFIKRVYGAGDPSVNHLVIVPKTGSASHEYASDTDNDYHRVKGINGAEYMYYLLFASYDETSEGTLIDDSTMEVIIQTFLASVSGLPSYVTVTPESGSLAAGNTESVSVTIDPADVPEGRTSLNLVISSNDPDEGVIYVPISFTNNTTPGVEVSATSFSYGDVYQGHPVSEELEITNVGSDQLEVSFASDNSDFSVSEASLSIAVGESVIVEVAYDPTVDGAATGTITLTSNDPDNATIEIAVDGNAITPALAVVNPEAFRITMFPSETFSGQLTIENTQGLDLDWSLGNTAPAETLEEILANINAYPDDLTDVIPSRYDFVYDVASEGALQASPFSYGNLIVNADVSAPMLYSENSVTNATNAFGGAVDFLGTGSMVFTRQLPGLFVWGADINGISELKYAGELTATSPSVDGTVLEVTVGETTYQGFVKRVYGTSEASVNNLFIIEKDVNVAQELDPASPAFGDGDIRYTGLDAVTRFYMLVYTAESGYYIDDTSTEDIMTTFLETALGLDLPDWVTLSATEGVTASGVTETVDITIVADDVPSARELFDLKLRSNDVANPKILIPFDVQVANLLIANDLEDIVVNEGFVSQDIGLSNVFLDADSDPLTYGVFTSNSGVVTVAESLGTLTVTEVGIGTATISVSADDGNGNVVYSDFTFRVNAKPVILETIVTQNYDAGFGSAQFDLTEVFADPDIEDELTYMAFTSPSGVVSATFENHIMTLTEVGIGSATISLSANDGNDAIGMVINVNVSQVSQTITFDALSSVTYGDSSFELTATGGDSGNEVTYVSSNTAVATVSGNTVTIVGVGTTEITASQEGSYVYEAAADAIQELVVDKAILVVAANDQSRTYGEANPDLTLSYSGFANGEDESILDTAPQALTNANTTSDIGTHDISVSGGADANYSLSYVSGTLTITSAQATITLSDLEQQADGTAKEPTVVTSPAGLAYTLTFDGNSDLPTAAGTYQVVATIDDVNYEGQVSDTFVLVEVLGVNNEILSLNMYPNPTSDQFEIRSSRRVSLGLYDLNGILLIQSHTNQKVDVSHLNTGVYLVLVEGQVQRLMINR